MPETKRLVVPEAEEILDLYFPVLDHGYVSLLDYMGGDAAVEEAARTSYQFGNRTSSDTRVLIRSLMRRRHTSPSEQIELKFHMAMPIFVARQIVRHRTASLNELSGRYSLMPMLFYTPTDEQVQAQSKLDKQGRNGKLPGEICEIFRQSMTDVRSLAKYGYEWATENDIARELARIDLPLSIYTVWYWKIDAHNLMHALSLRCDAHAQWETRQYFNVIAGMLKRVAPLTFEAWEDYTFNAKRFSHAEMRILRNALVPTSDSIDVDREQAVGLQEMQDEFHLTKTECREFLAKFDEPQEQRFDLDLSKAKPGSHFQELFERAATNAQGNKNEIG